MAVLVVIPARFASSRFPGKPLEMLAGAGGKKKSLIRRCWEAASLAAGIDRLVVATDDVRIRAAVEEFGGECVMTSSACQNGTERCAEVSEHFGEAYDIVVNVQGDAPLTPPWFVEELVAAMRRAPDAPVATPVIQCTGRSLEGFRSSLASGQAGGTTAVFDAEHRALYFSKQVIPWTGEAHAADELTPVYHHVGVYGFRPEALRNFADLEQGPLEDFERLEQLRFLENRISILCVEMDARGRAFWEVNNPSDVALVESGLAEAGIE